MDRFDRCGFDENVDVDQDICKISLIGLILFSVGVDEIVVTSKFEIFRTYFSRLLTGTPRGYFHREKTVGP